MFSYKALKPRTRLSSGRAGCAPLCGLPPTRTTYAKRRSGASSAFRKISVRPRHTFPLSVKGTRPPECPVRRTDIEVEERRVRKQLYISVCQEFFTNFFKKFRRSYAWHMSIGKIDDMRIVRRYCGKSGNMICPGSLQMMTKQLMREKAARSDCFSISLTRPGFASRISSRHVRPEDSSGCGLYLNILPKILKDFACSNRSVSEIQPSGYPSIVLCKFHRHLLWHKIEILRS